MGNFNLLTDAWIPLDAGGAARYVSFVDLLSGSEDAPELIHPREDCRFFARMLLSALTQALFPTGNAKELKARIASPLPREQVQKRIDEVKEDFELVGGSAPWMQSAEPVDAEGENETRRLLLDVDKHLLFRRATNPDTLCHRCGVLVLYGLQAFVPGRGAGYSPNVRGAPPTTTLVLVRESVRKTAWANTLHQQTVETSVYGPEPDPAWRCGERAKEGSAIGLVEGLFWKPCSLRLDPTDGPGKCATCGSEGLSMLQVHGFGPGQQRKGGLYRHPLTPCRRQSKGKRQGELGVQRLSGDKPAWTEMANWISGVAGGGSDHGDVLPAPVVSQWTEELMPANAQLPLLVLDYGSEKASITHLFTETFPLSIRLKNPETADRVRARVADAEKALDALQTACVRLHMKTRPGARLSKNQSARVRREKELLHEVIASFWQRTEPAFWKVYESYVSGEDSGPGPQDDFRSVIRRVALDLFNAWAGPSLADPSRIALAAETRVALSRALPWPGSTALRSAATEAENV